MKTTMKYSFKHKQSGFNLIEILVSIVILSIGLLGLAALQNTSIKLSFDSYVRTQASFLAYDLIDRIRANPSALRYTLRPTDNPARKDCFAGNAECSPNDLRQFDLYYWKQSVNQVLPNASIEITFDEPQNQYQMKLTWSDRIENDVADDENKEFIYHFQIDKT